MFFCHLGGDNYNFKKSIQRAVTSLKKLSFYIVGFQTTQMYLTSLKGRMGLYIISTVYINTTLELQQPLSLSHLSAVLYTLQPCNRL